MTEENLITQPDPELPPTADNAELQNAGTDGNSDSDELARDAQPASEGTQQQPDQQPAGDPAEEFRQLLSEAEERGYRRGLNQQLREALQTHGLFEDLARRKHEPTSTSPKTEPEDPLTSRFLTSIRPGIWD